MRQAPCKARVGKAGRAIASRNETWHGQVRGKSGAGEKGQREGGSKKGAFLKKGGVGRGCEARARPAVLEGA